MAQAKEIVGLDCNGDVYEWIREILRVRFEETLELRENAMQSENVEAVHDMRVAIRRLRTALRDFNAFLKQKPAKKLKRELKQLADALGTARDADVAIMALEKLHRKTDDLDDKDNVEKLIEQRRKIRLETQTYLVETFNEAQFERLQNDFDKLVSKIRAPEKAKKFISFNEAGSIAVGKNLDDFRALSESIYQPLNDKPLHKLRIAAKHLRYAIELYTACWGEKITPFAEEISDLQSFLGNVHDADVWLEDLSRRLVKESNSTNIKLLSSFAKKRTKNYQRALKLWNNWQKENFLENLQKIISQSGG